MSRCSPLFGVLFALCSSSASAAPNKSAAAGATADEIAKCKAICDARDNVSCPKAPKEAACNASCATAAAAAGSCRAQFDGWLDAEAKWDAWKCDGEGYPTTGMVVPASYQFWQCFSTGRDGASPTPAVCGPSSNDPTCDSAIAFTCPTQALACGADTECKAIGLCLDKCPNRNDEADVQHRCIEKCKGKHPAGRAAFEAFNKCAVTVGGSCSAVKSLWDTVEKPTPITYFAFTHCTLIAP